MAVIFKQCIAFLLLVCVILQTFSQAVICVDFYANREYIARNLCVNRNKPAMHCNGHCQLCKRLVHEEGNKDKSSPERKITVSGQPLLAETAFGFIPLITATFLTHPSGRSDLRVIDRPGFCFHPPD
ncbi:MAG TPA: hypothetical protein VMH27_21815 [Puia sp.]|nr:hypothetical protein [Puia sp.]